jgi:hypothetical protein
MPMYNFIFYVIYCQQIQKEKGEAFARYNGSLIVGLAIFMHICFFAVVLKKVLSHFYEIDFVVLNKGIWLIPVLFFFTLVFIYYNKERTQKILNNRYSENLNPTRTSNYIKVLCIIFIPLVIIIALSKK